jgi:glutaredoxin 3
MKMSASPDTPHVTMYSTRFCPYCVAARRLLDDKGVVYEDIAVDGDPELRAKMTAAAGRRTVPQIWIGGEHVGGFDELAALDRAGRLDAMLGLAS